MRELNSLLAGAVTPHEEWILDQEQNNGMDLRDVLLHLEPLKLDFGMVPLGTRRTVQIHLRNSERSSFAALKNMIVSMRANRSVYDLGAFAGSTSHGSLEALTCRILTWKHG